MNVQSDATTRISQTLSVGPTPTPLPGTGSIAVHSTPAGAEVYLDNAYVGISPLTIPSVSPGSHVVLLTMPGYANWQATVQVQRDVIASVDATLSPAPTAAPTKSGLPVALAVLGVGLLAVAFMAKRR